MILELFYLVNIGIVGYVGDIFENVPLALNHKLDTIKHQHSFHVSLMLLDTPFGVSFPVLHHVISFLSSSLLIRLLPAEAKMTFTTKISSDPKLLLELRQSLTTDPDSFAIYEREIIDLSRRAMITLEKRFETANRIYVFVRANLRSLPLDSHPPDLMLSCYIKIYSSDSS